MSMADYYRDYQTIKKKNKIEFCVVIHNSTEWSMTLTVFPTVHCAWKAGSEIQSSLRQEMEINSKHVWCIHETSPTATVLSALSPAPTAIGRWWDLHDGVC